jgi:hypothetical protein
MNLKRWRLAGLVLVLLMLASKGASRAQTTVRPNALAYFHIIDVKPYSFLAVFAPGEAAPLLSPSTGEAGSHDFSPDGQWIVGLDTISLNPVYVSGPGIEGLFDDVQTTWVRSARFSVDGRYLLYKGYVLSTPERDASGYYQTVADRLLVGIMDLSTRQRLEMLLQPGSFGASDYPPFEGNATYWFGFDYFHFDGQTLFVHQPDSLGFYAFDLSGIRFADQPAAVPAPSARPLFEALTAPPPIPVLTPTAIPTPDLSTPPRTATAPYILTQAAHFQVSPDGTRLALWRTDTYTANTPGSNERLSTDTLFVYDLTSRRVLFSRTLDGGNTIQALTWTPESAQVLFIVAGADPLYALDLDAQTITAGPSLIRDTVAGVQELLACDSTLFFVGLSTGGVPTLYSAPLDDWTTHRDPLDDLDLSPRGGVEAIHLVKCMS